MKDLSGRVFSQLTVKTVTTDKKRGELLWFCLCQCGSHTTATGSQLRNGKKKSCGCLKHRLQAIDLSGQVFGRLNVICMAPKKGTTARWECHCSCGNKAIVEGYNLRSNHTTSCGCHQKTVAITHGLCSRGKSRSEYKKKNYFNDPGNKLHHNISCLIRYSLSNKSKKSSKAFNILPYTLMELKTHLESKFDTWMNWGNYGLLLSDNRNSWHVDHIIPRSQFTYHSEKCKEFIECWSLSNLRPLDKWENNYKRNKMLL